MGPISPQPPGPPMVVLDFSGTLSLGAVLFGATEHLEQELRTSGLAQVGVSDAAFFWEELVNPTWEEGSTTPRGYKRVLYDRLRQVLGWPEDHPMAREAAVAVERFVDSYLCHSTIDPAWRDVIARILERDSRVIVASDHYAEFTDHIVSELRALGLPATPALRATAGCRLLVANSADLGCHKATPGFWERLRPAGQDARPAAVVMVDDLGLNEEPLDTYAVPARARQHLRNLVQVLSRAYGTRVAIFPFLLHRQPDTACEVLRTRYHALIDRAEAFIRTELERS